MPSASLVKEFENLIGKENVFTSEADRQSYAYDAAVLPSVVPGLVLRPTSTEQLGALIERCYANGLPMTIRGAGTNLSGGRKRRGAILTVAPRFIVGRRGFRGW